MDFQSGNTLAGCSNADEAKLTVKDLLRQRADIMEKIDRILKSYKDENSIRLAKHIRMALDGVHPGYMHETYYAPERWYVNGYEKDGLPELKGVKNFRKWNGEDGQGFILKLTSPAGELFPESIIVDGVEYEISFRESQHFDNQIDY